MPSKLRQLFIEYKIMYFVFLVIQNIVIFSGHYFDKVGFPWDFPKTNYAWPAFSTTSISMGIFPQWMPYEAMGYPLAINPANGLYYPPYWIFSLLHIPFTLDDAVILQVLTVLIGSFGMFLLLNLIFKSPRYALIGAVAFQFFGGFYSNAESNSIVNAFAIAPWLFYVFTLDTDEAKIARRNLFIPLVLYFLVTGGYFGNFISTLLIIPVFLFLQLVSAYQKTRMGLRSLRIGGVLIGLTIIGITLSSVYLSPIYQERNELTRFDLSGGSEEHNGLVIQEAPALYMSSRPLPGEPSQISTFVTLPMLIFASFIPVSGIKKHWVFVAILILSTLMVMGPQSPFWRAIGSVVHTFELSRYPSSDYRVFVAIPLIILGVAGLKAIIELGLSWKEFLIRAAFVITWFSVGVYSLYSYAQNELNFFYYSNPAPLYHLFSKFQVTLAVFILFATILFITYYLKRNKILQRISAVNKPIILSGLSLIIVVLLVLSDGFRVISDMQTWNVKPFNAIYINYTVPLEKNGKLITYSIFENIPNARPPRENCCSPSDTQFQNPKSWVGYLNGSYIMQDYTHEALLARSIVESSNIYRQYMLMKWTPLLLEPNLIGKASSTSITLPVSTLFITRLNQTNLNSSSKVIQTHYGINDIAYKVSLKEPRLMVENEIYFPGWQADLIYPHKEIKIPASEVNGVFRAWLLPAGDYKMVAHYDFPNLIVYQTLSIVSFVIWIFIIARYWRRLGYRIKKQEFVGPVG